MQNVKIFFSPQSCIYYSYHYYCLSNAKKEMFIHVFLLSYLTLPSHVQKMNETSIHKWSSKLRIFISTYLFDCYHLISCLWKLKLVLYMWQLFILPILLISIIVCYPWHNVSTYIIKLKINELYSAIMILLDCLE